MHTSAFLSSGAGGEASDPGPVAPLVRANREIDERRAFIEAVLESMSAGIVSVDEAGTIQLMNTSARVLLFGDHEEEGKGRPFAEASPQIAALLDQGVGSGIVSVNQGAELLTLAVRIAPATGGHVITFEDITRQLLDQRRAAWSDVARRIAHEIKNPLSTVILNAQLVEEAIRDLDASEDETAPMLRRVDALVREGVAERTPLPEPARGTWEGGDG